MYFLIESAYQLEKYFKQFKRSLDHNIELKLDVLSIFILRNFDFKPEYDPEKNRLDADFYFGFWIFGVDKSKSTSKTRIFTRFEPLFLTQKSYDPLIMKYLKYFSLNKYSFKSIV